MANGLHDMDSEKPETISICISLSCVVFPSIFPSIHLYLLFVSLSPWTESLGCLCTNGQKLDSSIRRASCALEHSLLALSFSQSIKDNYIFFLSLVRLCLSRFSPILFQQIARLQLLTQQFYIVGVSRRPFNTTASGIYPISVDYRLANDRIWKKSGGGGKMRIFPLLNTFIKSALDSEVLLSIFRGNWQK